MEALGTPGDALNNSSFLECAIPVGCRAEPHEGVEINPSLWSSSPLTLLFYGPVWIKGLELV
jgi:hypothetical protein